MKEGARRNAFICVYLRPSVVTMVFYIQELNMRSICLAWLIICVTATAVRAQQEKSSPHKKWEKAIAAFEKLDEDKMPPKEGIVFVGSSSIVLWKINDYFSDLPIIQRGFGG